MSKLVISTAVRNGTNNNGALSHHLRSSHASCSQTFVTDLTNLRNNAGGYLRVRRKEPFGSLLKSCQFEIALNGKYEDEVARTVNLIRNTNPNNETTT